MRDYNDRTPHRLMPFRSRHTRSRRRWQHALDNPGGTAPPPPAADYIVSGALTPNATGDYFQDGMVNDKPAYRRADSQYWIWWFLEHESWLLSLSPYELDFYWERNEPDPAGEYPNNYETTGVALVTAA